MNNQIFVIINDFMHNGEGDMDIYQFSTKEDAANKFFELVKEELSGDSLFCREFSSRNVELAPMGNLYTNGCDDSKEYIIHQYNEKYSKDKPCLQFWGVSNKKTPSIEHDFIRLHRFSV